MNTTNKTSLPCLDGGNVTLHKCLGVFKHIWIFINTEWYAYNKNYNNSNDNICSVKPTELIKWQRWGIAQTFGGVKQEIISHNAELALFWHVTFYLETSIASPTEKRTHYLLGNSQPTETLLLKLFVLSREEKCFLQYKGTFFPLWFELWQM